MTLAVGMVYPIEGMADLAAPGWSPARSIIMATDSRWTWVFSDGHTEAEDQASKMFKVHERTIAVYAGASKLGEECLGELRWSFQTGRLTSSKLGRDNARDVLNRVYRTRCASLYRGFTRPPLYFLLGTCTPAGVTELCYFAHDDGFTPREVDYRAIGSSEAVCHFHRLFRRNVDFALAEEKRLKPKLPAALAPLYAIEKQIVPEHVAMLVTSAIQAVIDTSLDNTVGGHIQCAVLKRTAVELPSLSYTSDPTNQGPGWTRVTVRPGELRTLTETLGVYDPRELTR